MAGEYLNTLYFQTHQHIYSFHDLEDYSQSHHIQLCIYFCFLFWLVLFSVALNLLLDDF